MPPPPDQAVHDGPSARVAPGEVPGGAAVGIDAEPVTAWFCDHVPGVSPPLTFALFPGGRSNLTFRVDDSAGHSFVLRRPPVSHVLATAHDMSREHRVMSALRETDVPVPTTFGLCEDTAVTGAPFYVMSLVDGHILRDAATAEAAFDVATRGRIGDEMADTLAALHAVDPDDVGLGDLGRRDGYVERQLRRWGEQYRKMAVPGVDHGGLVEAVGDALSAALPAPAPGGARGATIVHGDFRLDNVVLRPDGGVAAVLDWEICTLGDPLADVGLLMVYWAEVGDGEPFLGQAPPTFAPGFSRRDQVLARYAEASGRDVSGIGYYMAFGYWKLACILQGVYARYVAGAGAGDPASVDAFPRTVDRLARLASDTLAEYTGSR
jgi:aminoglycoside phosphotransferase (APT) family kinase protein